MIAVITAILLFGVIILVHELGHFIASRLSNVAVREFSIGIGPVLWSKRHRDTQISLRLFPIGGYNLIEGEDDYSGTLESFSKRPVLVRLGILSAGSIGNLLLGYVVLVLLTILNGYIGTTTIAAFNENSVSSQYLSVGDQIYRINGARVRNSTDIIYEILRKDDGNIVFDIRRDGGEIRVPVQFSLLSEDGETYIDVDFKVAAVRPQGLDYAVYPANWGISIVRQVWSSLLDLLRGKYGLEQLSGPVGVVSAISSASALGVLRLMQMFAFITINVGVFNLLPIPALDGGKILILLLEGAVGRPIPQKASEMLTMLSMLFLIALILFATFNDILRVAS